MQYKSEAAFSRALMVMLHRHKHCMAQRIESGETGVGIPDLYIRIKHRELWLELKNMKYASLYDNGWEIPWRRGQQSWAHEYHRVSGQCTYTVVALKNGFLWIPMDRQYVSNWVGQQSVGIERATQLNDIWGLICES